MAMLACELSTWNAREEREPVIIGKVLLYNHACYLMAIFTAQTLILSFVPIIILLAQNGYSFYDMMKQKEQVMHKADLVNISKFYKPLL